MLSKHHLLQNKEKEKKKERKKEVDKHCGQSDILLNWYSMCEVIVTR